MTSNLENQFECRPALFFEPRFVISSLCFKRHVKCNMRKNKHEKTHTNRLIWKTLAKENLDNRLMTVGVNT